MKMRVDLAKDWHLYALKTTEPLKFKRTHKVDNCLKLNTWHFEKVGNFSFQEDAACNPNPIPHPGFWEIENKENLKIIFQPKNNYVDNMAFRIAKISADTLKLNMETLIFDADINLTISGIDEYTFIRK